MKGKLFQSLVQTRQQQRLDKHINFFRRLILFFNLSHSVYKCYVHFMPFPTKKRLRKINI